MTDRIRYSKGQLDQYFDRICFPQSHRRHEIGSLSDAEKLEWLSLLYRYHLIKVPWENLSQHYSWHRAICVHPQHVFRKIVTSTLAMKAGDTQGYHHGTNRGGYCMEVNFFLHTLLLSFGFDIYMTGARVWEGTYYGGFTHNVLIVTIANQPYVLDVGFGLRGPIHPIALEHGTIVPQVAPSESRIVHEPIAQMTSKGQKVWIYQIRWHPGAEWTPVYSFVDIEFLPTDIQASNFEPWKDPQSFFTHKLVICRFVSALEQKPREATTSLQHASDEGPGSPDETKIANADIDSVLVIDQDRLRWRQRGEKIVNVKLRNEKERLEALRKYFGIVFDELDEQAVIGSAAEVTGAEEFIAN